MHRTLLQKLIYRPRAGTFRAKQLEELKQEENLKAAAKFIERNIGNATRRQQDNTF